MGHNLLAAFTVVALALPAAAADVEGSVRIGTNTTEALPGGQPIVVYLTGFSQPALPGAPTVISQKNKAFIPSLRVIVAGQSVQFTNDDPVVHNVFSTSAARAFDLGKPGPQQTREVTFPTPGLVDVYCNIHEAMFANVLVLPNRAFALVDEKGHFTIRDVPPGRYPLHAWGRNIEPFEMDVVLVEGKPAHQDLVLNPRVFNPTHLDKFGRPYRARPGYVP